MTQMEKPAVEHHKRVTFAQELSKFMAAYGMKEEELSRP